MVFKEALLEQGISGKLYTQAANSPDVNFHHEGRHPACCQILDDLHMGHNALNPLHLAAGAITT